MSDIEYDPTYDDYTSDEYPPDWKGRAREIRKRDGYTCQDCGVKSTRVDEVYFHVDHIIPKSDGGSHEKANLQSLCPACHATKHPGNTELAERADEWQHRNDRSWIVRVLRVLFVVPVLLALGADRPRVITDQAGRAIELTPVSSLSDLPAERGVSVDIRVATLWDNSNDSIQQVGLLAPAGTTRTDDCDVVKFVTWAGNDLPEMRSGATYRIIGALTDEYDGNIQLTIDGQSEIQPL